MSNHIENVDALLKDATRIGIPRKVASELIRGAEDSELMVLGQYFFGVDHQREVTFWFNPDSEDGNWVINGRVVNIANRDSLPVTREGMARVEYWIRLSTEMLTKTVSEDKTREEVYGEDFRQWVHSLPSSHWLAGSECITKIELSYDPTESRPTRTMSEPGAKNVEIDLLERDRKGHYHLWELKKLSNPEWQGGKALSQLVQYEWRIRSTKPSALQRILERRGGKNFDASRMCEFGFSSLNILVVGGGGWELAAGVNPSHFDIYPMMDRFQKPGEPPFALYHFFATLDGWALQYPLRTSLIVPGSLHPDAYARYAVEHGEHFRGAPSDVRAEAQSAVSRPWLESVGR